MYTYIYDESTGGILLTTDSEKLSKEPRPVYYKELDILGFDKYWNYPKDDSAPLMWAEAANYYYRGRHVAKTKGGALYTAPELLILEEPEPNGKPLVPVDIEAMVKKNADLLESLSQETIRGIYNTYVKYKDKVDLFYVAFSGGKDSVVTLDLVSRALPHNEFMVLFGDTGMEFPDTYDVVDKIEQWCSQNEIRFLRSKSKFTPQESWKKIGPPAQKMRWCCSVHKTAPQILLLRNLTKNPHFRGMALMGVRAEESVTRRNYKKINFGTKHEGQFDYYPILEWSSAELYLYIYTHKLILNETYKRGNSRAGCLVCPMESIKNSWFKRQSYSGESEDPQSTDYYFSIIINDTLAKNLNEKDLKDYLEIGVWKSRHNGKKLLNPRNIYHENKEDKSITIILDSFSSDWKEWLKTVGDINYINNNIIEIFSNGKKYILEYKIENNKHTFKINNLENTQQDIYFISWIKAILKKSAYCILCQVCEANCPNGHIHMENDSFYIDNECTKCKKCYNVSGGCLVATSQKEPKEIKMMKGSIDQYKNMGVQYNWVKQYMERPDDFFNDNSLGDDMEKALKLFLRHAKVTDKNKLTNFGEKIVSLRVNSSATWGLLLSNLVYTPQFNWWTNNIEFNRVYTVEELNEMFSGSLTENGVKNARSGFKNIFYTNPFLSREIGFGIVSTKQSGKNILPIDFTRKPWQNPDPRVILYSLYKFAEECGGMCQFTLSDLLDDTVERDGISPTRIFGIPREDMVPILNGLAVNYPDLISATFSLNLEKITLKEDKTSEDVLEIF